MANLFPNGTGQSLGDQLVTARPLLASGQIWYVSSVTGSDAGGTAGLSEAAPLATLAQAITNASANDFVVLMDGHTETIGSVLTVSKTLTILGGGSSGGLPTVKLKFDHAESSQLTLDASDSQLRNVWIVASITGANANPRVYVTGDGVRVTGCYFDCDQYDDDAALKLGPSANNFECIDCTIVSTATSKANQPAYAVKIANAIENVKFDGLIIDAGAYGFSALYPFDGTAAATTMIMFENLSLLRGADMKLHASTTGYVHPATVTGGSKIIW